MFRRAARVFLYLASVSIGEKLYASDMLAVGYSRAADTRKT